MSEKELILSQCQKIVELCERLEEAEKIIEFYGNSKLDENCSIYPVGKKARKYLEKYKDES